MRPLHTPDEERLPLDVPRRAEILARHAAAIAAGESQYIDPTTRYSVMTAAALRDRGTCCDNGCRHCPYC